MRVWQPGQPPHDGARREGRDWSWRADGAPDHDARPARARRTSAHRARDRLAARRDADRARAAATSRSSRSTTGSSTATRSALSSDRRPLRRRRASRPRVQLGADVLHRLDGRADPRRPAQPALPAPAAALARLLRAQPRRRAHQPAHERRRGARPARHRRRHDPRPEHADPRRHGGDPLPPRLAARARDARRLPAAWRAATARLPHATRRARYRAVRERLGLVTATLAEDIAGMRVVQAFTRERANARSTSARSTTSTARRTTRRSCRTASTSRSSTSSRRPPPRSCSATAATSTSTARSRSATLLAFMLYLSNFFDPVQQLSQLYNTFLAAVAALDKIMDVHGRGAGGRRRTGRPSSSRRIDGHVRFDARPLRLRRPARRCCTGSTSTSRPARRSRSSATPAPASRRSRSCSRASTTRGRARSRSTASTCAT